MLTDFLRRLFPGPLPARADDVRMAILAYCYGSFAELAYRHPAGLLQTFEGDAAAALRARLASAGAVRAGVDLAGAALPGLGAERQWLHDGAVQALVLDFDRYGGRFTARGASAACPHAAVALLGTGAKPLPGLPAVLLVEPAPAPATRRRALVQLAVDGTRTALGPAPGPGRGALRSALERFVRDRGTAAPATSGPDAPED